MGNNSDRIADAALSHQGTTLRGVLAAGTVVLAAVSVFSLALGATFTETVWTYGVGLVLHVAHLLWSQRGSSVRRVAISHCVSYLIWVTLVLALRLGGLRAPAALVYPPLILVAGLVWSGRAAIGMAILSSAIGAVLVVLEKRGILTSTAAPISPERFWIVMTACVLITAVVLRYALDIIHRSAVATLQSERRYEELVESAPDAMLSCDAAGNIRACNSAAGSLWDCDQAMLLNQSIGQLLVSPGDAVRVLTTKKKGRVPAVEIEIRSFSGAIIPVEVRTRRSPTNEGEPAVHLTVRDIRERRAAVAQQGRLEAQLRQAQRLEALGRLAGGVAHDFNNLLTIILGNVAFARSAKDERAQRAVDAIEEATGRAADLTRQLLALGRRQVFESDVVDLNAVATSVQSMLRRLLPEDVTFQITTSAKPCWVAADRTQLSQVIVNLVTNARDAVRAGGTISVTITAQGSNVVMKIKDDGVGMSEGVQAHLFEPFFTTKESAGTGLGLATVHGIVSQLGGQITVKSAEGEGSEFTLSLPRAPTPVPTVAEQPQATSSIPAAVARVMVIEDDAAVRDVVCAMLVSSGYQVVAADGAESAHKVAAQATGIDLVVSDVVLNDTSGPIVVAELMKRFPRLKVLFVSGHAEGLIAQRGMLRPGTHFLAKPFTQEILIAKVERILSGSSTRHDVPSPITVDVGHPS